MPTEATGNRFLDSLSSASAARLVEASRLVDLPLREPLFRPEREPEHVWFLTSGIASFVFTSERGTSIELSTLGREGVVGAIAVLGDMPPLGHGEMQLAGAGYRMSLEAFREEFRTSPDIRERLLDFVQLQWNLAYQIVACNRLHSAHARFSRWLLMVQDRVNMDVLPMTQEFLADMLGTRRTTVGEVAGELQRRGAIEYRRGIIRIVDREKLQHETCECYSLLKERFDLLYSSALPEELAAASAR
jgi:CRP-like cAMP-binding protein